MAVATLKKDSPTFLAVAVATLGKDSPAFLPTAGARSLSGVQGTRALAKEHADKAKEVLLDLPTSCCS